MATTKRSESGILEKWNTDTHFEKNLRRIQQRDQPRKKTDSEMNLFRIRFELSCFHD